MEPAQIAVWPDEDENEEYFNCPVRFIPESVEDWIKEHMYNELYSVAPEYKTQSARYVEALFLYRSYYNEFSMEVAKRKNKSTREI